MIRVVIDANVFLSAILKPNSNPDKVIDLVKQGRITLALSHDILAEIRKVLLYPKIRKELKLTTKEIGEALAQIAQAAIITSGRVRLKAIESAPDDNRYLECAGEATTSSLGTEWKKSSISRPRGVGPNLTRSSR
jgi:putative PIN family toxin of toxin-antitoxin system